MTIRSATILLAFLALLPADVRAQKTDPAALALATFDSAWARVRAFHYDSTFGGMDWDAVRSELRPQVERAPGTEQVRRTIRDMISRLGVSHYALIPREVGESLEPGQRERSVDAVPADAGLELRAVGGDVVVWRIDPESPAAALGLRPGARVLRVGKYDAVRALADVHSLSDAREQQLALTRFLYGVNGLLAGQAGDTVPLVLDEGGKATTVALPLRPTPGRLVRFGNVPPSVARVTHRREPAGESCVGVIRWTIWLAPIAADIDRAVDAVRDCRGIVLDLRGNPGGVAGMVMGIGGHFVDSTRALGTMKMRGNTLRFVINPRRVDARGEAVAIYEGKLAILTDAMSASTSEIFAAGMQAIGRARVFGDITAGQALPALAARLPNGDVLMHAIADYLVVDQGRVEGKGVIPDESAPLTLAAVSAGKDPAFEAARRWILAPND